MKELAQKLLVWLLGLLMLGCTPVFKVELAPPPEPDQQVIEWQKKITDEVNDHEKRLQHIEVIYGGCDGK